MNLWGKTMQKVAREIKEDFTQTRLPAFAKA